MGNLGRCGSDFRPEPGSVSWEDSFLRQARSDLECFFLLTGRGMPLCQQLHYLQMAGEKLAKSRYAAENQGREPAHSHKGLSDWIRLRIHDSWLRKQMQRSDADFRSLVRRLTPTAQAVEHLAPARANALAFGVNVEYPWLDFRGVVVSPLDFRFSAEELGATRLIKFASFLDTCISAYGDQPLLR